MSKERDAFMKSLAEGVGRSSIRKEKGITDAAGVLYDNLRGGKIKSHVATTMALYTRAVLPELSLQQCMELTKFVHTMVMTTLTYVIEDGIPKEE